MVNDVRPFHLKTIYLLHENNLGMQKGVGTTDEETIFPLLYTDACPSQNSDKTPHLHFMYCIVYRIFLPPPLCNLIQDIPAAANLQIVYRIEIVYSTYAKLTKNQCANLHQCKLAQLPPTPVVSCFLSLISLSS